MRYLPCVIFNYKRAVYGFHEGVPIRDLFTLTACELPMLLLLIFKQETREFSRRNKTKIITFKEQKFSRFILRRGWETLLSLSRLMRLVQRFGFVSAYLRVERGPYTTVRKHRSGAHAEDTISARIYERSQRPRPGARSLLLCKLRH